MKNRDPLRGKTPMDYDVPLAVLEASDKFVAKAGALFLDKIVPGWHVDPRLSVAYWSGYDTYTPVDALFADGHIEICRLVNRLAHGTPMRDLGFLLAYNSGWDMHDAAKKSLRAAWRAEIASRLAKAA